MVIKYASGTIFYNDCKSLERTLESLKDKVDWMICIDGRFKHFKDNSLLSTDGSRELVNSYDKAVLVDVPNSYEIQKRSAYLRECERVRAEYLLIIDSDEYIYEPESDWELFDKKVDEYCSSPYYGKYNLFGIYTEVNNPNYDHIVHRITGRKDRPVLTDGKINRKWQYHPRLWHRPYEMEYNKTHYMFRNKNPANPLHQQEHNATVKIIPHLKIGHDHLLRNREFLESREDYQTWLVNFEQKKLKRFERKYNKVPSIDTYDHIDKMDL